jgi:hypothetical protein
MSDETRALLLTIREQAHAHAVNSAEAVQLANNRNQDIIWSATALEAASILAAIDIALSV